MNDKRKVLINMIDVWMRQLNEDNQNSTGEPQESNIDTKDKKMENKDRLEYPIVLTAKEISKILKISKPSAYELMKRSDFPLVQIGRCKRVLRDDFFEWLRNLS